MCFPVDKQILNEAIVIEVNANSPRLAQIEELFEQFIDSDGKDVTLLNKIRLLFNMEIRQVEIESIAFIPSRNPKEFFGAQVMPSLEYIEEIVSSGIKAEEMKAMEGPERLLRCVIEIDQRVITDCHLTGRELMAIVLHEIGHTLSDAKLVVPKMFCVDVTVGLPAAIVTALGLTAKLGGLYSALGGVAVAAIFQLYSRTGKYWYNLGKEKDADSVAVKCGLGKDLFSATEKMVEANLVESGINSNQKDDAKRMAKWGFSQILHLRQRQHSILRMLRQTLKDEQSPTARQVLIKQIKALEEAEKQRSMKKTFGFGAVHQYGESVDMQLNESIRSFMELQRQGFSSLEVDEIEIEIGRIETSDDKIYLVQRISKDINIANKAIAKLKKSGREADVIRIDMIRDYIEQLKALIPRIKAVKTQINPYTFVIKYPKGDYEEGGDGWE